MKILEPAGLILILLIVLILFGPKRLPDLGKSFRRSMKAFKEEVEDTPADDTAAQGPSHTTDDQEPSRRAR